MSRFWTSVTSGTPERENMPNSQRLVIFVYACVGEKGGRSCYFVPWPQMWCSNVTVAKRFMCVSSLSWWCKGDGVLMRLMTDGLSDRKWYNQRLLVRKSLCKSLDLTKAECEIWERISGKQFKHRCVASPFCTLKCLLQLVLEMVR